MNWLNLWKWLEGLLTDEVKLKSLRAILFQRFQKAVGHNLSSNQQYNVLYQILHDVVIESSYIILRPVAVTPRNTPVVVCLSSSSNFVGQSPGILTVVRLPNTRR